MTRHKTSEEGGNRRMNSRDVRWCHVRIFLLFFLVDDDGGIMHWLKSIDKLRLRRAITITNQWHFTHHASGCSITMSLAPDYNVVIHDDDDGDGTGQSTNDTKICRMQTLDEQKVAPKHFDGSNKFSSFVNTVGCVYSDVCGRRAGEPFFVCIKFGENVRRKCNLVKMRTDGMWTTFATGNLHSERVNDELEVQCDRWQGECMTAQRKTIKLIQIQFAHCTSY